MLGEPTMPHCDRGFRRAFLFEQRACAILGQGYRPVRWSISQHGRVDVASKYSYYSVRQMLL
jgi:hypothetical protein